MRIKKLCLLSVISFEESFSRIMGVQARWWEVEERFGTEEVEAVKANCSFKKVGNDEERGRERYTVVGMRNFCLMLHFWDRWVLK